VTALAGTDLFRLDDLLADEHRLVRRTAARFVDEEFLPVLRAHHRAGTFPTELIPRLGALGLLGMNLEGHGCPGAGELAYGLAMRELERGDSGLRSFCSVQGSLAMYPIHAFGDDAQKRRFLPELAAGKLVGCFGLTEPDHGSDPAGMESRARRDGAGWVLNGRKMWITNGSIADVAVVWAKTDDGIRGFLVERGTPGFSAPEMKGKWSLRASVTSELVLEDVVVDEERSLLPGVKGLKGPLSCLTQARYGIAWGALGAADACYQAALDYALQRVQFDKPIASFQLQQEKLAVKIAIINNGYLGMVRQWQELFHNKNYSATPILSPDFVKLAEAFDVPGIRVTRREEVVPAVQKAMETAGPVLVEFRVEKEDMVWPMVPAGTDLGTMLRRPLPPGK
jgi:glutaryl-CoA dehydrogenase